MLTFYELRRWRGILPGVDQRKRAAMTNDSKRLIGRLGSAIDSLVGILRETYSVWRAARTLRLGAGIAYYSLFALVPLLSIAAALVGVLISTDDATAFLKSAFDDVAAVDAGALSARIVDGIERSATGLGVTGVIVLLISASFLFVALQDALNVIWDAPVRVGLRNTVRRRLLAFGVTLLTASVLISSFLVEAVIRAVDAWIPGDPALLDLLGGVFATGASWMLGVVTIAFLFRLLPYAEVSWRNAFTGAAATVVLVVLGTSLIGSYISRYATSSISGATGSVVAVLLWVYYEVQIILAGAVLTRVLQERRTRLSWVGSEETTEV